MAAQNVQKRLVRQALGAEIARVRKQQGMVRQSHLAEATGLGVKTISDIETGRIVPREQTMRRIETALHLPIGQTDDFLNGGTRQLKAEDRPKQLAELDRAEAIDRANEIARNEGEDAGTSFMLRWADAVRSSRERESSRDAL